MACEYPSRIDVPNGISATRDDMISGQKQVKEYVATMEAYLDCIVADEKSNRADMDSLSAEDEQLREEMLNKKYNAAVEEMERVAAEFNAEVRAFKEREDG
ncbi:MAG: hypothetical protein HKP32_08005 [Woeseia sp.]|nr:hypothetical protein [Woeseia sp.]NNL55083.1 hypothetical protein [Woeseia sp.]